MRILLGVLATFFGLLKSTNANFNLFLTKTEVNRILGLPAEMYYVREGVVNEYAMNFSVPISADVHELYFNWKAVSKKPVLYNIAIWYNDTVSPSGITAMYPPQVNVSLTGSVPMDTKTFKLSLPCTGKVNLQVDVIMNINVTSPRPKEPPIKLFFKRKKICLKGQSAEGFAPHQDPLEENNTKHNMQLVYFIVPTLAGVTLVLTVLASIAFLRKRGKTSQTRDHSILTSSDFDGIKVRPITANSTLLRVPSPSKNTYALPSTLTLNSYASLQKVNSLTPGSTAFTHSHTYLHSGLGTNCNSRDGTLDGSKDLLTDTSRELKDNLYSSTTLNRSEVLVDPNAAELQERFRHLQIERQRVRLTSVMAEGKFGRVYRGWVQRDRPEQDQQVVIKTVIDSAPQDEVAGLCRDGTRLFNLYHVNVLTMVGVSFADNSPPFLIFPYHGTQNLKLYLQTNRGGHLRAAELVELAVQAAQGLAFLHAAGILHTDIAARNCVVSEKLQLRLVDNALSKDIFPKDYESVGNQPARPVKWMSYEAITDRIVSNATDVWSYGVLLWELTTLAQQPYVEVAACEMAEYLRDGYRLAQPLNCPDDLYKVMAFCWAIKPGDRPRAPLILDYLAAFHKQMDAFI